MNIQKDEYPTALSFTHQFNLDSSITILESHIESMLFILTLFLSFAWYIRKHLVKRIKKQITISYTVFFDIVQYFIKSSHHNINNAESITQWYYYMKENIYYSTVLHQWILCFSKNGSPRSLWNLVWLTYKRSRQRHWYKIEGTYLDGPPQSTI